MTKLAPLHPQDTETIDELRTALFRERQLRKLSAFRLSRNVGRNGEFVSQLEQGDAASPKMSSLQMWAGGLDLRIEFTLEHFWMIPHMNTEMITFFAMSRPWGADAYMRQWLVSALRQWRVRRGIDVSVVAPLLGTDVDSVRRWEDESTDPLLGRAMWQARHTGTRLLWSLWRKEDWTFL